MIGGRKTRSNKGKKRGAYGSRKKVSNTENIRRKVRSNKGKKRQPYGPRMNNSGRTRSGAIFRGRAVRGSAVRGRAVRGSAVRMNSNSNEVEGETILLR